MSSSDVCPAFKSPFDIVQQMGIIHLHIDIGLVSRGETSILGGEKIRQTLRKIGTHWPLIALPAVVSYALHRLCLSFSRLWGCAATWSLVSSMIRELQRTCAQKYSAVW